MQLLELQLTCVSPPVKTSSWFSITVRKLKSNNGPKGLMCPIIFYLQDLSQASLLTTQPTLLNPTTSCFCLSLVRTQVPLQQGPCTCSSLGPKRLSSHGSRFQFIQVFSNVSLPERSPRITPQKRQPSLSCHSPSPFVFHLNAYCHLLCYWVHFQFIYFFATLKHSSYVE